MNRSRLTNLFLFVFVDLLGYSLFLPLLPYFATSIGITPFAIGLLAASNAIAQFLAAPVFGRLSDRYGRRPLLIVSVSGTILSFIVLALSSSYGMLLVSRILDGLLGGSIALARAYITDVTDERNRAQGMGLIGAAFGLGFIVGPALGGFLSNWPWLTGMMQVIGLTRFAAPALVAALLAAINLVMLITSLPESLTAAKRAELRNNPRTAFTARALVGALKRPCLGPLLSIRLFYSLAFALFTTNFALYAAQRLRLTDRTTSYTLAYVGLLSVLVQGLIVGRLARRYPERQLILAGLGLLAVMFVGWALTPNLWVLLVVLAPIALSGGVVNTIVSSAISKAVPPEEAGGTLGLASSLESLAQMIAPILGGAMLQWLPSGSLGLLAAGIVAFVLAANWAVLQRHAHDSMPGCGWAENDIAR